MSDLTSVRSPDQRPMSLGTLLIVALIFLLCLGVMYGGILQLVRYQIATNIFTEALATVTKSSGSEYYTLTIQFIEKTTGTLITTTCSTLDQNMVSKGQVRILYDPENPMHAELKATFEGNYLINAFMATFGGAIIVVPFTASFIIKLKHKHSVRDSKQTKRVIQTNTVYCQHCGFANAFDSHFCEQCGKNIELSK